MTEQEYKKRCAEILRDNITFAGQTGDYIISGALDNLWKLHVTEKDDVSNLPLSKRTTNSFLRCMYDVARKDNKLAYYMNAYNVTIHRIEPLLDEAARIFIAKQNK